MKKLVIIGASGHGKVVADIASLRGEYSEIVFLDDNFQIKEIMGYKVVGNLKDIIKFVKEYDIFVAIGDSNIRKKLQHQILAINGSVPILIHPTAVIADTTKIGVGTVVMANAVVNPNTIIGEGCIINTGATIDHDNIIKDYSHISVGAHLAGTVEVGEGVWIGIGAIVSNNITICDGTYIGAGAVVIKNIEHRGTYLGVPAKIIKES